MYQRLTRRRKVDSVPGGNLWLRSDLRQPPERRPPERRPPERRPPPSRAVSRPATTSPVVRSWLTWTLFGALLVTTAAAGHGYLITEPKTPGLSSTALSPLPAQPPATPVAGADYGPGNTSSLPALYALEDTQQQLILQVEAIQASNRAMLDRLEHLQAALAPEEVAALTP